MNEDLDDWYENTYGGDEQYRLDSRLGRLPERLVDNIAEEYEFSKQRTDLWVSGPNGEPNQEAALSDAFAPSGERSFFKLGPHLKARFRDHIESLPAPPVADPPLSGPGWPEDDFSTNITLLSGARLTEGIELDDPSPSTRSLRDRAGTELPAEDYEPTSTGAAAGRWLSRRLVFGGGGIFALLAVGVFVVFGGGGDSTGTGGTGGDSEDTSSSSSGGAAAGAVAVTDDRDGDICAPIREQQITLELSSPDVQPTLPLFFAKGQRDENDFPSPQLDWPPGSNAPAVPPEATEIVLLVMSLTDERADLYQKDEDLWWDGVTPDNISGIPIGRVRWTVTGMNPTATSLPPGSRSNPPRGAEEHFSTETVTITAEGVDVSNKFIGAEHSGEWYLFTVFALCNPTEGERDEYDPGWFKRHAIAIGWFFTQAEW